MSDLQELYAKKQELKDLRSRVLVQMTEANTLLAEIADDLLTVDLDIRKAESTAGVAHDHKVLASDE